MFRDVHAHGAAAQKALCAPPPTLRAAVQASIMASDHLKGLIEAALWEIADESAHAPEHTALDATIDSVRANVMSGMMPEEANLLFRVTEGGLSSSRVAAPPPFHPVVVAPTPIPTESPSSVVDGLARMDLASPQGTVLDSDGEEWDEWPAPRAAATR